MTFVYATREDRVLVAINPGRSDAWSCWLTRRIVLALLDRLGEILASTSPLAQQAPAEVRRDVVAFEHDAAMAKTAERMTQTPADALNGSASAAELVEQLSNANQDDNFRLEFCGTKGGGASSPASALAFSSVTHAGSGVSGSNSRQMRFRSVSVLQGRLAMAVIWTQSRALR